MDFATAEEAIILQFYLGGQALLLLRRRCYIDRAALLLLRLRRGPGARPKRLLIGAHKVAGIDQAAPSSGASRLRQRDSGVPPIGVHGR